ncbi:PE-PGRS family protein [Sorangium sp. So ce1000]|uniref:PE-PGRS family protein n=1 Tax=Sorangium sp. So ce1000 TaxID=3133325 RepID=UPI003F5FF6F7
MLSQKTVLQLALCLTIGLSAAACSDDDGETTSATSGGTSSTTSSSSTTGQGGAGTGGQGGAGTGGEDSSTGGQGGGTGGQGGAGTGGQGGAGTGGQGGAGEGGSTPSDPACGADAATFAEVRTILNTNCAGAACHGSPNAPPAGLDLRANMAHGELVDGASATCAPKVLVVPGKPSESYLINKLKGEGLCADGKRMPPTAPLSAANIKKINDWICAGAPE